MPPINIPPEIFKLPNDRILGFSIAFAIADSGVLRFSKAPNLIPINWLAILQLSEWVLWALVFVFGVIVYFQHRNYKLANQKLIVTLPLPHTHLWQETKQQNGEFHTLITADVFIKNNTDKPLGLSFVKLKKPIIKAPILHNWALIKDKKSVYSATTVHSALKIDPFDSNLVNLQVIIGGSLNLANSFQNTVDTVLSLIDEDGLETEIKASFFIQ